MHAAAAAKLLQSCLTLCDPIDGSSSGSPVPEILQARTRVGCHFLLQCRKVKSGSEVAQSGPTLRDPMDCSPPGSSVHGIFQARVLEWGAIALVLHQLVFQPFPLVLLFTLLNLLSSFLAVFFFFFFSLAGRPFSTISSVYSPYWTLLNSFFPIKMKTMTTSSEC